MKPLYQFLMFLVLGISTMFFTSVTAYAQIRDAGVQSVQTAAPTEEAGPSMGPVQTDLEYGVSSRNIHNHNYMIGDSPMNNWASVVNSYLVEDGAESVCRVEAVNDSVVIEKYRKEDFTLLSSQKLPYELSLFGGFFAGKEYYYLVYGQGNHGESDDREVIRIVQYNKKWERVGSSSLYGGNTTIPFHSGSLRMCESGNMLYIRTCHQMYTSKDGLNHQANLTLCYDQAAGKLTDAKTEVENAATGYCSHSFNQFIKADSESVIAVDHGDAYPRGIILNKYGDKAGEQWLGTVSDQTMIVSFPGEIGFNWTDASLGGLEISDKKYLLAYNYVDPEYFYGDARNVYLAVVDKGNVSEEGTKIIQFTQFDSDAAYSASNPMLIPVGQDEYYLMWELFDASKVRSVNSGDPGLNTIQYVKLDGEGNAQGEVQTAEGTFSDCMPILTDGKLVWYVTDDTHPAFYSLNLSTGEVKRTYKEPPAPTVQPADASTQKTEKPVATSKPTEMIDGSKKPGKVTGVRLSNKGRRKLTVRWSKAKRANCYKIQIAGNRKFTKRKKTVTAYSRKYIFTGLKKGRTYYVRVRGYDYSRYGNWSSIKKIKLRK